MSQALFRQAAGFLAFNENTIKNTFNEGCSYMSMKEDFKKFANEQRKAIENERNQANSFLEAKRNHLKSDYSKAKAPVVFEDLINNIKGKIIVVSYNNTYDAKSGASNNKISEEQLETILSKKGKLTKIEIDYKFFNAGKTDLKNHKEYLYVCEVYD